MLGVAPIETVWLVLFPDSLRCRMYLCCAYCPPSCSIFFDSLITETETILSSSMSSRLAILGDFNCDILSTDLPHTKSLLAYCDEFHLHNIIDSPTRITEETSSLLDLSLNSDKHYFSNVFIHPCSYSDNHNMIGATFVPRGIHSSDGHKFMAVRRFSSISLDRINQMLATLDWNSFVSFDDVNESVECLSKVISDVLDLLFPIKYVQVKWHCPPWGIYPQITEIRRLRNAAHRRAISFNTPAAWAEFRVLRNRVTSMMRSAEAKFYKDLACDLKSNGTDFWKSVSFLSGKSVLNCLFLQRTPIFAQLLKILLIPTVFLQRSLMAHLPLLIIYSSYIHSWSRAYRFF